LRGCTALDFLAASPLETLEVDGQTQVQGPLFGEFLAERVPTLRAVISVAEALASGPTDGGFWIA